MEGRHLIQHSWIMHCSSEAEIIDFLDSTKKNKIKIALLELIVEQCEAQNFHYALVFLGDVTMKIMGKTPDDVCDEVCEILDQQSDMDESIVNCEEVTNEFQLKEVGLWLTENLNVQANLSPSTMHVLGNLKNVFLKIANHYHNPCSLYRMEGNGFATWIEQKNHLGCLLAAKNPKFSDFLPIISFLSRKPFLDCSSSGSMDQDLAIFDKKWEKWLSKYPLINHILDPSLVVVELIEPGPQDMTLQQLMINIFNLIQDQVLAGLPSLLPSGQVPRFLGDAAGPMNSTFSGLIQCATMEDANILGGILRSHYQSASGHGGVSEGATIRIGILATSARGTRVF